ncbi:MAG: flagellin [Candidatus Eremiobacteraeota bacterium]|nr:flagellin [Candidatus Eremiobacteraeota bacterium]
MNVLGGADNVLLNFNRNQQNEATSVRRLASGLRIQSAADDPSGLTISESLKTNITGLQQSVNNVQTAGNLLNVVDNALNSVVGILQRIRSLTVESRSDINSSTQLQAIQTEINQLLQEVNKIGSSTNFNGLSLLNGAFDTSAATQNRIVQIASPLLNANGSNGSPNVSNYDGLGNAGPLVPTVTTPGSTFTPAIVVFQVTGYSANAIDYKSGTNVGPGDYVQVTSYGTSSNFGPAPEYIDPNAQPINAGIYPAPGAPVDYAEPGGGGSVASLAFTLANLTPQDVGATVAFEGILGKAAGTGHALNVNDGGVEGSTVGLSLPTINTDQLGLSGISVLAPGTVMYNPATGNYDIFGQSSSNNLAAADAQFKVDQALQTIGSTQAQVGAQMVALQQDSNNAGIGIVNYTASQSMIADTNIASTVTDFTRQQILTSVGTSVLSSMQVSATTLTSLLFSAKR